jgi:hypothetical protein
MNAPEAFFPLRLPEGSTALIARDHVVEVEVPSEFAPNGEWSFGDTVRVEVVMQGGAIHAGAIQLEQYMGHERVLDHLNRSTDPFLLLKRDAGLILLNRRRISLVRPLDDAAA